MPRIGRRIPSAEARGPAPAWLRYAFAVAAVAAAVGLRFLSAPLLGDHVFVVFLPAVILAAWHGGGGPAAVASLLAVLSANFFFFPPPFSLTPAPAAKAFQLVLFLVAAGLVGGITSRLRDARARAHETARQLEAVISSAVDGNIVIDGRGRILRANRAATEIFGFWISRPRRQQFAREEVEVGDVASEVADDLALHSEVEIDVHVAAPLGVISGDRARVRRVLSNLLTDVIKHSTAGGKVSLHVIEDGDGILVRVSDGGRGIPPEDQPRVFDRYWRGRDGSGGLGLGLAIAREIVEAHKGRIWLESEPGRGTTFFVKLPRSVGMGTEGEESK